MNISNQKMIDRQNLRFLNAVTQAFILVDTSGLIFWANAQFIELTGYGLEKLVGCSLATLASNGEEEVPKLLRLFSSTGEWIPGALALRRCDNRIFDFPCEGAVLQRPAEDKAMLVGIRLNDQLQFQILNQKVEELRVENRRRLLMEQKLRKIQASLCDAQRIANVGSWEWDRRSGQFFWSDELYRIFQEDSTSVEGSLENFLKSVHPDDLQFVNQAFDSALTEAKASEIVHRLLIDSKFVKYVMLAISPEIEGNGDLARIVGTVQDITLQKIADDELQAYREHLEELVQARTQALRDANDLNEKIVSTDLLGISAYREDGTCIFANVAMGEIIGATHKEVLSQNFRELKSWTQSGLLPLADQVLASGKSKVFDLHVRTTFGKEVCIACRLSRFLRSDVPHLLLVVDDISESKKIQSELVLAKENAEKASKTKSLFLSRMSHELRTPMNAIMGYAQLLEMQELNPKEYGYTRQIRKASDHLLDLIDDLLDFSTIESGKLKIVIAPVVVLEVINEARALVQSQFDEKDISFVINCDSNIAVMADEERLRQVLVNLLSNASKYNRERGTVIVSCFPVPENRIQIRVTDTGLGIEEEKKHLLFKSFESLGAELTGLDGVGVGLALSKQLAELMGGSMDVTSVYGKGSTFWIELPSFRVPQS